MIVSALRLDGVYRELMISAWISAIGSESTKCSEQSDNWPPLGFDGLGVLES